MHPGAFSGIFVILLCLLHIPFFILGLTSYFVVSFMLPRFLRKSIISRWLFGISLGFLVHITSVVLVVLSLTKVLDWNTDRGFIVYICLYAGVCVLDIYIFISWLLLWVRERKIKKCSTNHST